MNQKIKSYLEFLKTKELNNTILKDFDQTGYWTVWGEMRQNELKEAIGETKWAALEKAIRSLKIPRDKIEYTDSKGRLILNTSYVETGTPYPHKNTHKLQYLTEINIPHYEIKGCIKSVTATEINAPNLAYAGSIVLLQSSIKSIKDIRQDPARPRETKSEKRFYAPSLEMIKGDLRAWQGTNLITPNLKSIKGDLILEDSEQVVISIPSLRNVGKSIFCRRAEKIVFPNLTSVGEAISGFSASVIEIPSLKHVKALKLDFSKIPQSKLEKVISNLSDESLIELSKKSQTSKTISIANPKGSYLQELINRERLKRYLLKESNSLSIE
jgi:hypothetical protein